MSRLPSNKTYASHSYWNSRFETEESYEWLNSFSDLSPYLLAHLPPPSSLPRVLLVGVGNSGFSGGMYEAGWTEQVNTDYAGSVVEAMGERCKGSMPRARWEVMDMTDMGRFGEGEFDAVVDKAGMDAIVSDEGDVWCPNDKTVMMCRKYIEETYRVLKPGGVFVQVSFAQPHFRTKYLEAKHLTEGEREGGVGSREGVSWEGGVEVKEIEGGGEGCFQNFFYHMKKKRENGENVGDRKESGA